MGDHKSSEKYNDICTLKHQLLHYVMGEVQTGFAASPAKVSVLGEYIDMIKDLAETEKYCQEACYYESVVEAMDEYGGNPRMGYDRGRNAMGQYVSDGRTTAPRGGRSQFGNRRGGYREGVDPYSRMMMEHDDWDVDEDPEMGHNRRPFDKYRKAKRHYTETHSESDKQKMKDYANEHVMESIATLREIWDSADPELKKRMKADMTKLVGEMNV